MRPTQSRPRDIETAALYYRESVALQDAAHALSIRPLSERFVSSASVQDAISRMRDESFEFFNAATYFFLEPKLQKYLDPQ